MSATLIGITTVIYMGVAISFFVDGRVGMGGTFVGYAIANIGLIYDAVTKGA